MIRHYIAIRMPLIGQCLLKIRQKISPIHLPLTLHLKSPTQVPSCFPLYLASRGVPHKNRLRSTETRLQKGAKNPSLDKLYVFMGYLFWGVREKNNTQYNTVDLFKWCTCKISLRSEVPIKISVW